MLFPITNGNSLDAERGGLQQEAMRLAAYRRRGPDGPRSDEDGDLQQEHKWVFWERRPHPAAAGTISEQGGWAGGVISVSIKKHFILLGSRGVNREPTELFLFPATLAPLAQPSTRCQTSNCCFATKVIHYFSRFSQIRVLWLRPPSWICAGGWRTRILFHSKQPAHQSPVGGAVVSMWDRWLQRLFKEVRPSRLHGPITAGGGNVFLPSNRPIRVFYCSSGLRWGDGDTSKPESPAVSHQGGVGCEHAPARAIKTVLRL